VIYNDQRGYVEDITYTYVLIQTWDQRRLIVPLRSIITQSFENWTKRSAHLMKPIYLYLDYTVDVNKVREKFDELLRVSDDWDEENPPVVQVTQFGEEAVEVRALCSAQDAMTAWDLHCHLREQLLNYVRDLNDGSHLPRRRLQFEGGQPTATKRTGTATAYDGA
jgi:small-conductance mechanosensitive channel